MPKYSKSFYVDIDKLKENPKNRELPQLSKEDFDRLKDSLEIDNQINPIILKKDFTIVAGHQRVRAAKELGWKKIRAQFIIPEGDEAELEVERVFYQDNLWAKQWSIELLEKVTERVKKLTPLPKLFEKLVPEIRQLAEESRLDRDLIAHISEMPKEAQRVFYEKLKMFFEISSKDHLSEEDIVSLNEVFKEREDDIRKVLQEKERLERELLKLKYLKSKFEKERMGMERLYQKSLDEQIKLKKEIRELKEQMEKARELAEKDLQKKIQAEMREKEESMKLLTDRLTRLEKEKIEFEKRAVIAEDGLNRLKKEVEEQVNKNVDVYKRLYEEKMKILEDEKRKLQEEKEKLRQKQQEIASGALQEDLGYQDEIEQAKAAAKYLWYQIAALKGMIGSLEEASERARALRELDPKPPVVQQLLRDWEDVLLELHTLTRQHLSKPDLLEYK